MGRLCLNHVEKMAKNLLLVRVFEEEGNLARLPTIANCNSYIVEEEEQLSNDSNLIQKNGTDCF